MSLRRKITLMLASTALLSACAIGPDYHRPPVETPVTYKELQNNWKPGQPQDAAPRGPWWSVYNDPVLNDLELKVAVSNQNLKAEEAAYREATAVTAQARSSLFPTISVDASGLRSGGGNKSGLNNYGASAGASWEPDLWGRIRRTIESDKANAEASAADLASATLSAQGTLAVDYFELRATDQLKRLLDATVADDTRSLQITQNQYKVGIVAESDVVQAQTEVENVQAQAINVGVQRAQLEHAIAVLIGRPPSEVTIVPAGDLIDVPSIPVDVPSAILQRRPDIAEAERRVAAANAEIGVAETAYFPDVTLSASDGFAGAALGSLFRASNNIWSIGPDIALTVLDFGARRAAVEQAGATYDQTVALYRQSVLTGFQQVEDQLAALRILAQQATVETQAVASAKKAERLILNQYQAGTIAYTSVITVQTQALASEENALNVQENRLTASVQLIEAMGGRWNEKMTGNQSSRSEELLRFNAGATNPPS